MYEISYTMAPPATPPAHSMRNFIHNGLSSGRSGPFYAKFHTQWPLQRPLRPVLCEISYTMAPPATAPAHSMRNFIHNGPSSDPTGPWRLYTPRHRKTAAARTPLAIRTAYDEHGCSGTPLVNRFNTQAVLLTFYEILAPSLDNACAAACCSASFLDLPVPWPNWRSSIQTSDRNSFSWAGPRSSTIRYSKALAPCC
ncbi:MAG: hypothetical protein K0R57_6579 [Paenibacillaceae bacterium]|nr:hypothetical protein [Paenibacillaceae bacterium]